MAGITVFANKLRFLPNSRIGTLLVLLFVLILTLGVDAQHQFSTSEADGKTMTIGDSPEMQVIAIARTVIVQGQAKEVFCWGGDVIIEGRVEGDVAAIGGNVIQRGNAFIGGDIIVIGGTYKPEAAQPLRTEGKETVVFGVFEAELRDLARDPKHIFAPEFNWSFVAQKILSIIFWFVITLLVATIAPGAISRASARFQLSPLRVLGLGFIGFLLIVVGSIALAGLLPEFLAVVVGMMAFVLVMLAFGFGRVALNVSLGKFIQRKVPLFAERSESVAILLGVIGWTILLSVPYLWTLALLSLFAAGTGLVLTARNLSSWGRA